MFRHRFDVRTMLHVFELNVKNPAFAQQKNNSNAKGFSLKNYSSHCHLSTNKLSFQSQYYAKCFWASCEEPHICPTENITNAKGFLWRTSVHMYVSECIYLLDNLASEWANTDFMLELCSVLNINIKKLTFARHDTNTNASLNYEDLLENQNLWGLFSKIIYSIVRKITSSEWL